MSASIRLSIVLLACGPGLAAWQYSLYTVSNVPTEPADHVPAFDVAISGMPAADRTGNIYLTGRSSAGAAVWKIGTDGVLMPFAGQGSGFLSPGDSMPAVLAGSLYVEAMAVDAGGNVFLAGGRNGFTMTSLYRVTPDAIAIYVVTPSTWTEIYYDQHRRRGQSLCSGGNRRLRDRRLHAGEDSPDLTMTTVSQMAATAMVSDAAGDLYIANRYTSQIVKFDTAGNVTQWAQMNSIAGLALDGSGNLYVSQDSLAMVQRWRQSKHHGRRRHGRCGL